MDNNGEIIIYKTDDGLTKIQVDLHDGSVWLSANQWHNSLIETKQTYRHDRESSARVRVPR